MIKAFTLADFVTESNHIEGLGTAQAHEIAAHVDFLGTRPLTVEALQNLVTRIAGASLRAHTGMDVRVGTHYPPHGGARIIESLKALLIAVNAAAISAWDAHQQYE